MAEQVPFGATSFAENPDPRCPSILLLDTSGSMGGQPIAELNAGIQTYKDELAADPLAAKRVEVAMITFGGRVETVSEFATVDGFRPQQLNASGDTPMGEAILRATEMLKARKEDYRRGGVLFYRPWIFLITDGAPTDDWQPAAAAVRDGEAAKAFMFFAVGVGGANFETLKAISPREPLRLDGLRFRDLFKWLSNSQKAVSKSKTGDKVDLPPPTWNTTT